MQDRRRQDVAAGAYRDVFTAFLQGLSRPRGFTLSLMLAIAALRLTPATAAVLPEDRFDALYHRYDGGGVKIDGPSVLLRKKIGESFSVAANYYIDMVSSASIDVELTASPYEEKRKQKSLSADYLRGKSTYSLGVINSKESDYEANTAYFGVSQDMFGDLTTVSLGFKRGWDDVFRNVRQPTGERERDPGFAQTVDRRGYSLGLSQILTRNLIVSANYELLTDDGYLNSPYRSVRFADPAVPLGFSFESEIYPGTRTSNAASIRARYFLPYRAALDGQYRFFTDTWGIDAHTVDLGYTHPAWRRWIFDARLRYYRQTAADFYSDLFPRRQFANFLARDKELATFQSYTAGVGASYDFKLPRAPWIQKSTANIRYDHLLIDYADFRDARRTDPTGGVPAGSEPLYRLNANVLQLFVSLWF